MGLRTLFAAFMLVVFCQMLNAQNQADADAIRKQMAGIRRSTDWNDPDAAKKANEQISELAGKLKMANAQSGYQGGMQQGMENPRDAEKMNRLNQEMSDQHMDVYSQIWKSAAGGRGADILLAEPLRDEIVQEFTDDESIAGMTADYQEQKKLLCIDMSMPGVEAVIDAMDKFKSIQTLVITGGKNGAPVNLNEILTQAAAYPLEELYIINFRMFVTTVPATIGGFSNLRYLALYNNHINDLPDVIGDMPSIKELYLEMNPLATLMPEIKKLTQLSKLGIVKTPVTDAEVEIIRQLLPDCKILF